MTILVFLYSIYQPKFLNNLHCILTVALSTHGRVLQNLWMLIPWQFRLVFLIFSLICFVSYFALLICFFSLICSAICLLSSLFWTARKCAIWTKAVVGLYFDCVVSYQWALAVCLSDCLLITNCIIIYCTLASCITLLLCFVCQSCAISHVCLAHYVTAVDAWSQVWNGFHSVSRHCSYFHFFANSTYW